MGGLRTVAEPRSYARNVAVGRLLAAVDRVRIRLVPRDLWVGVRVSHWYVDVCAVPCVCVRVARRRPSGPLPGGHEASGAPAVPLAVRSAARDPFDQDGAVAGAGSGRLGAIRALGS